MSVWCMNLKDNRNIEENKKRTSEKFQYCINNEIIAIGWQGYDKNNTINANANDQRAFICAINALNRMKKDDLIWIKSPVNEKRFLFKVVDTYPHEFKEKKERDIDIVHYRKCAKIFEFEKCELEIELQKLYSRRAIEKIGDRRKTVRDKILKLCKEAKE